MPLPGDGEGLKGPVQFAGWWFGSDFVYGERPDVEVLADHFAGGSFHTH